jgi:hypothetical protein
MPRIRKLLGVEEEFERAKLESSLRQAGASEQVARELATKLSVRDGLSTSELRSQVLSELRAKDAAAAERYESTRCCEAQASAEVPKDVVRLHPDILKRLGVRPGATLELEHAGKRQTLRAEESSAIPSRELQIHNEMLSSLGASTGTKLSLRRT